MTEISDGTIELATDTLSGDIASFLVDRFKTLEVAYRYMTEDQQREVISDAKNAAHNVVKQAVSLIAADGRDTIPVSVKKVVNDGEKVQATLEASRQDSHRHALFDAAGFAGHLTVVDSEKYEGGEGPQADPDEPELPGAGDAEAA